MQTPSPWNPLKPPAPPEFIQAHAHGNSSNSSSPKFRINFAAQQVSLLPLPFIHRRNCCCCRRHDRRRSPTNASLLIVVALVTVGENRNLVTSTHECRGMIRVQRKRSDNPQIEGKKRKKKTTITANKLNSKWMRYKIHLLIKHFAYWKQNSLFVVALVAAAVFGDKVRKEESVLARRRWRRFAVLRHKLRKNESWWCWVWRQEKSPSSSSSSCGF